jgi:hypothetical protein
MNRCPATAVEEYLHRKDIGVPLSEIKRRIAEYVETREESMDSMGRRKNGINPDRERYAIREGTLVEKKKLK